jgi:hypothetical protein
MDRRRPDLFDDDDNDIATAIVDADDALALTLVLVQQDRARQQRPRRGSTRGRMKARERNIRLGHESIMRDYLGPTPVFDEELFQRRYRVPSVLFRRLLSDIQIHNIYFQQRLDACGKMGASPEQKMSAALRMLANGTAADAQDEYCRIAESTVMESFHMFCRAVVERYADEYLRAPTQGDVTRILAFNERRGMPGLLGSLDCTHWRWKNCPTAWHGHYRGKEGAPTVVLEAVASADRWIWHAFFGIPGSNNDLNVLDRSPLLHGFLNGTTPRAQYEIGGQIFTEPYYFVDGIYPAWSTFIPAYVEPADRSKKVFTKAHEAIRKEVECAFGMLKSRFGILGQPTRLWYQDRMKYVVTCCIILHNMIIELRGDGIADTLPDPYGDDPQRGAGAGPVGERESASSATVPAVNAVERCRGESVLALCERLRSLQDDSASWSLRELLCRHYWGWNASQ